MCIGMFVTVFKQYVSSESSVSSVGNVSSLYASATSTSDDIFVTLAD